MAAFLPRRSSCPWRCSRPVRDVTPLRHLGALVAPHRTLLVAATAAAAIAAVLDGFVLTLLIPFLRVLFGAAAVGADVPTAVEQVLAWVTRGFLDTADPGRSLLNVAILILGGVAIKNAAQVGGEYLGRVVQEGVASNLREGVFDRLQIAQLGVVIGARRGGVIATVTADVEHVSGVVGSSAVTAVRQLGLLVVYVAILAALSLRLTVVTMALVPVVVLLLSPVLRNVRRSSRAAFAERGELSALLVETLDGARVVRAHSGADYESQRFRAALGRYRARTLDAQRFAMLSGPVSETLGAAAILLLLAAGTSWVGGGALRPEVLVAFVVVSLRVLSPVKKLAQYPALVAQAAAAAERIFALMHLPAPERDDPAATEFPGLRRTLAVRGAWFAYEGEDWVLRDVTVRIGRGEVVALVGPSGAGKSTLADLLPRFIEPQRGVVLVDDVPVSHFTRDSLRRAIGVVSQETVVFNDTVEANIAYGEWRSASRAQVVAAARLANAHAFIAQLPQGYDTRLGERGHRLSGGERQRIAIARALLRDPPILILDEATAHLDAASEQLVQEALARLFVDRTVLVIAHRLSTVRRADRIIVLERGRIVEEGPHDALVAADGRYRELYRLQLAVT